MLDDDPFPARLNEAGAVGYLTKGCPAKGMIEAVRTVSSGLQYVSANIARKHMLASLVRRRGDPVREIVFP